MDILDKLLSANKQEPLITGEWFVVQWTPNVSSSEVLNIGVGLRSDDQCVHVQMLDYFERIACLYSKDYVPQVELTCNVAREMILSSPKLMKNVMPQVRCDIRGRVQGSSEVEILNKLYSSVVTLGIKARKLSSKRFNSSSRDNVYNSMRNRLKNNLGLQFSDHVPVNPFWDVEGYNVYIPFKKNEGIATLVSAAYSDVQRVKSNLFEGFSDLDMATEKNKSFQKNAIFLLMPDDTLKNENKLLIENQIDKFYWVMKQHRVYCESHCSSDGLADIISEWCIKAA